MRTLAFGILLAVIGMTAFAQTTVPASADLSWTAPASAVDGTPLTGVSAITSYDVFVSTAAIPDVPGIAPTISVSGTAAVASVTVPNNSTLHSRVRACNVGGCGALSGEVIKPVVIPLPGVPTSVVVTIQIKP